MKYVVISVYLLFIGFCCCFVYAKSPADTIQVVEQTRLFSINACNSDVLFANRPTPCFALLHDTAIVFPAYKDTLVFLDFKGTILRKIYHQLGYPTYLYYNNERERLYFLNTGIKGEIRKTFIYELDKEGRIQDSVTFTGDWKKWWLTTGAVDARVLRQITGLLRKNKMGIKRFSIVVDALSDMQTIWITLYLLGEMERISVLCFR